MKFLFLNSNNKDNKYEVSFSAKVKNLSSKANLIHIVMPYPLESTYQKLIGKYKITPNARIKKENKFKNQYTQWGAELKPNEEKTFELKFKVLVKHHNKPVKNNARLSSFLKSDRFIDPKAVLKISNELAGNLKDNYEKVKILNNYVVNKLKYGNPIKGLYTTRDALKKDFVDCGGFDCLLVSLCIAQKIPARIVCGFFANENNDMHGWVEIYIKGRGWIIADPSIENLFKEGRTKKRAGLGFMDTDTIALSIGQDFNFKEGGSNLKLDILQNPEAFAQKGEKSIDFETEFRAKKI